MNEADVGTLTPESFRPLTGQPFVMTLPDGERLDLELWNVRLSGQRVPRGFRQQFAVEFRRLGDGPDTQGTFLMEHPSLGVMSLFLTPVQPGSRSTPEAKHYEAVFG